MDQGPQSVSRVQRPVIGVFMLFSTSLDKGHLELGQASELSYIPSVQTSQVYSSFMRLVFLPAFSFIYSNFPLICIIAERGYRTAMNYGF